MCQKVEKAVSQEAGKDNIPVTKCKSDNLDVKIKKKKKADLEVMIRERITKCRESWNSLRRIRSLRS